MSSLSLINTEAYENWFSQTNSNFPAHFLSLHNSPAVISGLNIHYLWHSDYAVQIDDVIYNLYMRVYCAFRYHFSWKYGVLFRKRLGEASFRVRLSMFGC